VISRESCRLELSLEPDPVRAGVSAADAGSPGARSVGDPFLHRLPVSL